MKPTAILIMLTALGLAGCAEYRPSEANCFETVTRSNHSMAFLPTSEPQPQARISTKSAPCTFTAIGGPEGLGDG
ncbi:hypothetical protein PhaeoP75_04416 (plasmid) [Phaeobacter gallaeciensis]|uniref:Lipoprotein n=1 Tax=Phaeobacter gallaeciensis TaxID=60890 RepID=A0AAC9ZCJ7_9RHOB|nr:hypothetical protein [Phaeobacter gallaeciensis]ATF04015.1 hypothetical protein PhaeoP75_04416 [Phaeobacter gallaeciensis]ATF08291.1 hypothetical protein PhaeoP63_04261 [Phaeobacter gallaeciensis]